MTLGEKLQALRMEAGLSQEDLAGELEVSRQAVSKWELDKTVPEVRVLLAYSRKFGVTVDALLKEEETLEPAAGEKDGKSAEERTAQREKCRETPGQTPLRENVGTAPAGGQRACTVLACGDALGAAALGMSLWWMLAYRGRALQWLIVGTLLVLPVLVVAAWDLSRDAGARQRGRLRRLGAGCVTLWGLAAALLWGFDQVIYDLLIDQVEGLGGIGIFVFLLLLLLGPLWGAGWVLWAWGLERRARKREKKDAAP